MNCCPGASSSRSLSADIEEAAAAEKWTDVKGDRLSYGVALSVSQSLQESLWGRPASDFIPLGFYHHMGLAILIMSEFQIED